MKKSNLNKILFCIVSIFTFISCASAAEYDVDISYGTVLHFIPGSQYEGVKCHYSGDTQYFEFSDTTYSEDHYVEMINPSVTSGSATAVCSYTKKKSHIGSNMPVVSLNGSDTFKFKIVEPKDLSKFKLILHRQFSYMVNLKTYFTLNESANLDKVVLAGDLVKVFKHSNNEVSCNSQSCVLELAQNAPTGTFVGTVKYGEVSYELTVEVKDEWVVYANTGGYGSCEFDEGWELNGNNANYYEKSINTNGTRLPICNAGPSQNNAYLGLKFVGWAYNKQVSNHDYNNYQSIDVCATYADNTDPNVGFIKAGELFAPANLDYDYRGNSVFYACYKTDGIGFNLVGYEIEDDTNGIQSWETAKRDGEVISRIKFKVFDESVQEIVLPSKVKSDGLNGNEVFVGWVNNVEGVSKIYAGGDKVNVHKGYIFSPYFMIQKVDSERTISVFTNSEYRLDLPSEFTCLNYNHTNYSIVGTGNKCVIKGKLSTDGAYLTHNINASGDKVFSLKIKVIDGSYSEEQDVEGIVIGDGDLIIKDEDDGGVSVAAPVDCKKYYVGRKGSSTPKSVDLFKYTNQDDTSIFYHGHIFTYYARSACYGSENVSLETEYASLCLDPGRASPPRSYSSTDKYGNHISYSEYQFDRYINVKDEQRDYREFSKAVAHIVTKLGVISLDEFNEANNNKKIAANIALRIVATMYPNLSVKPAGGDQLYANAFMAYQSMAMHLGYSDNNPENSNVGKSRPIKGMPSNSSVCETNERSLYIGCNSEWKWEGKDGNNVAYGFNDPIPTTIDGQPSSYTRPQLIELIAEYLSYGANESLEKDNWEVTPKLKYKSRDGNKLYFNLTFPRSIKFRYGENNAYDITLNLSDNMAKVYQFSEELIGTYEHVKCIDTTLKDGKCHRYAIRMLPDESPQAPEANHPIILNLIVDSNAPIVFPDDNARDIYLEVGYSSAYTSQSAFLVESLSNGDYQRMVLFNPEKIVKIFPLNLYDCNILLEQYGDQPDKYQQIYKAGCCETISDGSTEYQDFVNTYCKKDCVMNNFKPICNSQGDETNYEIAEAITKQGNTNYACIVDTRNLGSLDTDTQLSVLDGGSGETEAFTNTSSMTDLTGQNSIAIDDYKDNPYCRITCKENWSFNMPGYGDFLGANAVAAGSLFQINHSINLSSTVTCVSTHIDVAGYKSAVEELTEDLYNEYYDYSLRAATHDDIRVKEQGKYTWYTYDVSTPSCTGKQVYSGLKNCGVSGNYTMKCVNMGDHENCIDGQYHSSTTYPACDEDHLGETGCYREKTVTERCNYSASRNDPTCVCDARRNCERKKAVICDDDDTSCQIKGTYTKKHYSDCTTAQAGTAGCRLVNTTYPAACSTADVDSNGNFKGRTNCATNSSGACIHNCGFTGNYKKVEQTVHSGTGSAAGNQCVVYEIYTVEETSVKKYTSTGADDDSIMHGGISGDLDTDYRSGTVNYCNGETECEKDLDALSPTTGKCETDGNQNASTWKNHLIQEHTYYTGDSEKIRAAIDTHYENYSKYLSNLSKLSNEFAKCQNFNVYNQTIAAENSSYKTPLVYNNTGKLYSTGDSGVTLNNPITSSVNINTKLEPSGTFGYDEQYYMDLMKNDRIIAKNSSINYVYRTEMYNDLSTGPGFTSCYGSEGKYLAADGTIRECSESVDYSAGTIAVDSNIAGVPKQFEYVLCNLSKDYSYSTSSDLCAKASFYYYDVNYIKQSLTSSANYDNYVTWYVYTPNYLAFPGKGFSGESAQANAASKYQNYNYVPDEYNKWSIMGTKNVFPVSLTTRRNIYQYYYTFKGIGNYYNGQYQSDNERSGVGRIMGYDNSIIKSNSRICFYEVYESACICCGKNELGPVTDRTKVDAYQIVGYSPSSFDKGSDGRYGFTTSSVSLYNLNSYSTNSQASNWNVNETYFYNGSNAYRTDKGKELKDYIEGKGENVYAEVPEYSYILTPNAMANIKKDNVGKTYGFGKDTIYLVDNGTYLAHSNNTNHTVGSNETTRIIFNHYGSLYLKEHLSVYETPEYKDQLLSNKEMSNDCYVTSDNISSLNDKKKNCKWVDYVQTVIPNSDSQGYFRMAFK